MQQRPWLILFFCVLPLLPGRAQHPFFYSITDEQGLPSNEIYQMVQDDFGYIWIGCDAGLYRYDGIHFTGYTCSGQNGRSISHLRLAPDGTVWCKNFNGQVYCTEGDSLRIIHDYSVSGKGPPQFTLDNDGHAWICNGHQLDVYNKEGSRIRQVTLQRDTLRLLDLMEVQSFGNLIYFARYDQGIFVMDLPSGRIRPLQTSEPPANISRQLSFFEWNKRLYLYGIAPVSHEIIIARPDGERLIIEKRLPVNSTNLRIFFMKEDRHHNLWICSSEGALRLRPGVMGLGSNAEILQNENVSNVLHDREGNYWFSTLHNGVYMIPSMEVEVLDGPEAVRPHFTSLVHLSNGRMAAGTYTGEVFGLDLEKGGTWDVLLPKIPYALSVKKIREYKGELFISAGLFLNMPLNGGSLRNLNRGHIRDFVIVHDTIYYISYESFGRSPLLPKKNSGQVWEILRQQAGRCMEYDSLTNSIYVALTDGTYRYAQGKLTPVTDRGQPLYTSAIAYSNGVMWLASMNNGIYGLHKGKIQYHYTTANGLKENTIKTITAMPGRVFACSDGFLHQVILHGDSVKWYTAHSGVYTRDVSDMAVVDDQLWLATHKGLVHFPIGLDMAGETEPMIRITDVQTDSIHGLPGEVHLPYYGQNIIIRFSTALFRSRGQFSYQYRLAGLDAGWNTLPGSVQQVQYSRIPAGSYRFEVRAVNEYGTISAEPAVLLIHVAAPLWQRWWFYLVGSVIGLGILWLLFLARIRYVKRKAMAESRLAASQLTALKAQMNPHFMYNALNSIQELILKQDSHNSNLYLGKFSNLMRKVLEASGNDSILLQEETDILRLYLELEKLRFGDDFHFSIQMEGIDDPNRVSIPSMIIQPYVENAIKHGLLHKKGAKELVIRFRADGKYLQCQIRDNGVGRKKSAEIQERRGRAHRSFATSATQKRIELLNQFHQQQCSVETIDLEENAMPAGTEVLLRIPVIDP